MLNIHQLRETGKNYCQTKGSKHYRAKAIDPIEYAVELGMAEDFFLVNIIKYATRFKTTRNLDDLKKVSDYAHLMSGLEMEKRKGQEHDNPFIEQEQKSCYNCADKSQLTQGRCKHLPQFENHCYEHDYCSWKPEVKD